MVLVGVLVTAAAAAAGFVYAILLSNAPPPELVVRDVQITTAAIIGGEAMILWIIIRRVYLRTNDTLRNQARVLNTALDESELAYDRTLLALSTALEIRDHQVAGHSQRVARYAELIARELKLPNLSLETLRRGALLHDVGKIGVPDHILSKNGSLAQSEWAIMKRHPAHGARILSGMPFLKGAAEIVRHHHERYDGTGYPDGLTGQEIPVGARIFAVADAFDAITTDRAYRAARPDEEARREIEKASATQFEPAVVAAFLRIPLGRLASVRDELS